MHFSCFGDIVGWETHWKRIVKCSEGLGMSVHNLKRLSVYMHYGYVGVYPY